MGRKHARYEKPEKREKKLQEQGMGRGKNDQCGGKGTKVATDNEDARGNRSVRPVVINKSWRKKNNAFVQTFTIDEKGADHPSSTPAAQNLRRKRNLKFGTER